MKCRLFSLPWPECHKRVKKSSLSLNEVREKSAERYDYHHNSICCYTPRRFLYEILVPVHCLLLFQEQSTEKSYDYLLSILYKKLVGGTVAFTLAGLGVEEKEVLVSVVQPEYSPLYAENIFYFRSKHRVVKNKTTDSGAEHASIGFIYLTEISHVYKRFHTMSIYSTTTENRMMRNK